jgi:hypothetical protein
VAGGEGNDLVANGVQTLQLGGEVNGARSLGRPTLIETGDTNGVTGCDDTVFGCIIENPRKHSIEMFRGVDTIFHVQWDDDLTVGMCLIVIVGIEGFPEDTMVIDFTVNGEGDRGVIVDKGLGSRVNTDDTQTLVHENSLVLDETSTPIGASMTDSFCHPQSRRLEFLDIGMMVTSEDSTHLVGLLGSQLVSRNE